MKMLLVATIAAVLGTGSAFAQGLPPALAQQGYDNHAQPSVQPQSKSIFSELFGRFHSDHEANARGTDQVSKVEKGS